MGKKKVEMHIMGGDNMPKELRELLEKIGETIAEKHGDEAGTGIMTIRQVGGTLDELGDDDDYDENPEQVNARNAALRRASWDEDMICTQRTSLIWVRNVDRLMKIAIHMAEHHDNLAAAETLIAMSTFSARCTEAVHMADAACGMKTEGLCEGDEINVNIKSAQELHDAIKKKHDVEGAPRAN